MKFTTLKLALATCLVFMPTQSLAQSAAQAVAAVTLPSPVTNDIDPMVAYRTYTEALNSSRTLDAARYATQAWQLAETKWGSANPNTASLAYNAAWSAALVGKSVERMDAAKRAVELAPTSNAAYTLPEAQFLLAYAEYFSVDLKDRGPVAAKLAAAALPVETTWNDFLIVNALVSSANLIGGRNRGRAAIAIANRALVAIDRLDPSDNDNRALALLARAQGRLAAGIDREEAVADLIQARVAYGPMRNLDDKNWGALAAWELATRSVVTTLDNFDHFSTGTRIAPRTRRPLQMAKGDLERIYQRPSGNPTIGEQCDGIKLKMRVGSAITYPSDAANEYRVAGVVIRHDLDATGHVTNPRLLGSVPAGKFAENALAAIRTWQYDIPANLPATCMQDKEVSVSFVIS